ncbi:MAG: hypothetical protein LWX00_01470 [Spirochaetia bacterium]|nr:hypothetical protein [Spirochaetia bacterium]
MADDYSVFRHPELLKDAALRESPVFPDFESVYQADAHQQTRRNRFLLAAFLCLTMAISAAGGFLLGSISNFDWPLFAGKPLVTSWSLQPEMPAVQTREGEVGIYLAGLWDAASSAVVYQDR